MDKLRLSGFGLWRGGLLLVAGYVAFRGLRRILAITDPQLEVAIAVGLTGVLFVFASVVMEQRADARSRREVEE